VSYEEKLERASRLGARFIEYRPERLAVGCSRFVVLECLLLF
jgi:hypothetical protein